MKPSAMPIIPSVAHLWVNIWLMLTLAEYIYHPFKSERHSNPQHNLFSFASLWWYVLLSPLPIDLRYTRTHTCDSHHIHCTLTHLSPTHSHPYTFSVQPPSSLSSFSPNSPTKTPSVDITLGEASVFHGSCLRCHIVS